MPCEFCESDQFTTHIVREMMFGTREQFTYAECSGCGCLRIVEAPTDLSNYYPAHYDPFTTKKRHSLTTWLRQFMVTSALKNRQLLNLAVSTPRFATAKLVHTLQLQPQMRILDVGCGAGRLVLDLRAADYMALGIDRFAPEVNDSYGLAIKRCKLEEVQEQFDCIMFNHSLEHIADQVETLHQARLRLRNGGVCLVRIPIASWAWKQYGINWVQLDGPRHLCVHSEKSFLLAAEKSGFHVSGILYDSFEFQFWGSELYRRNVPLEDARTHLFDYFSKAEMKEFRRHSIALNNHQQGDQAIFFLRTE